MLRSVSRIVSYAGLCRKIGVENEIGLLPDGWNCRIMPFPACTGFLLRTEGGSAGSIPFLNALLLSFRLFGGRCACGF